MDRRGLSLTPKHGLALGKFPTLTPFFVNHFRRRGKHTQVRDFCVQNTPDFVQITPDFVQITPDVCTNHTSIPGHKNLTS